MDEERSFSANSYRAWIQAMLEKWRIYVNGRCPMKTLKRHYCWLFFPCARCGNAQQCGSPSASLSNANDVSVACPTSSSYPYLVEPISKDSRYNFLCTADSNVLPPPNPGTVYWSYNEPTNETGMGQRTVITPLLFNLCVPTIYAPQCDQSN